MKDYFKSIKEFFSTPRPQQNISEIFLSAIKIVAVFGVFYFAIFKFNVPRDELLRGILEYFIVSFALFVSLVFVSLIFRFIIKLSSWKLFSKFGFAPFEFLFIYALMMAIVYILKQGIYGFEKSWILKYSFRHFPYALLIYLLYSYRIYKNLALENLVNQTNELLKKKGIVYEPVKANDKIEQTIDIQVDGQTHNIQILSIKFVSVDGHYLDICVAKDNSEEILSMRKPLKEFSEELKSSAFLKIHRSHIVNLFYVEKLKKNKRQYSVEIANSHSILPVSRTNLQTVISRIKAKAN